ncbi:MAG: hypothetical protein AAF871_08275 [Pseudomonadota bacterium]
MIAVLLMGSGAIRLHDTWGSALAVETEQPAEMALKAEVQDVDQVIAALDGREARVAQREAQLDTRAEALALIEVRIDEKIARLEDAEAELRDTIALAERAAEDDLTQLTSVYENMGPEEAAALFDQMTPEFAAGFLGRMRADIAAAVLSGLEPTKAYEISVILAGRNALVPTE